MKVGLYLDLRNPPRWRRPWGEVHGTALERVEEAERLGLASVWLTEHHMFEDGYLSQPLLFAAAIAMRTSRVRIGTAVLLATLRPALDVAEQAAMVDTLSGGRLELGLGAGYRKPEFEAWGAEFGRRFALLEQRTHEIRRIWREDLAPPTPVPSPPLWIGGGGPRAARLAGTVGAGLLVLAEELLAPYTEALAAAGHAPATARMAGPANLILADDPEAAWARIGPHLVYQWETYRRYGAEGTHREQDAARPIDAARLRSPGPVMSPPAFDVVTPSEAIRRLSSWLGHLPVEHVFFWDSIAGMPSDLAERHLQLLASELAPALAATGSKQSVG